jgi:ubiquinone/menaquinone biosynthesis C-methylase UbiE
MTVGEKQIVKDFYDEVGWKTINGVFFDTLKFTDRRPVVREYFARIHSRVRAYLVPRGRFILDAASGPIPHAEQSVYSDGFDYRICLDFSFDALLGARARLGTQGLYILADIAKMPLSDNSVDAAISLHTLYHVPADEQEAALREIWRVLKPKARAVIVYNWGQHSALMKLASPDSRINRRIARLLRRNEPQQPPAPAVNLYFHPHQYAWFKRTLSRLGPFKLACWRTMSVDAQRAYIHDWLYGKQILRIIGWLEESFPWIFGRLGQYPMFVFRKPEDKTVSTPFLACSRKLWRPERPMQSR